MIDWLICTSVCVCVSWFIVARQRARILNVFKWIAVKTTNCSRCFQPSGARRGNRLFLHLTSLPLSWLRVFFLSLFQLERFLLALCENKVNNEGYLARPRARIKLLPDYPGRNSVKAPRRVGKTKNWWHAFNELCVAAPAGSSSKLRPVAEFQQFFTATCKDIGIAQMPLLLVILLLSTFYFPLSTSQFRSSRAFLWPLCLTLFVRLMRRAALLLHRITLLWLMRKNFQKFSTQNCKNVPLACSSPGARQAVN